MPAIAGLRSPYDKAAGGLHHLGRLLDKIRLHRAGALPEDFQRNYGLSVGLDGLLCGFLGVAFAEIEARVVQGGTDAEIAEWIFSRGLRPNRTQSLVWNEHTRKLGWNDRISSYLHAQMREAGVEPGPTATSLDWIELTEGRPPLSAASPGAAPPRAT